MHLLIVEDDQDKLRRVVSCVKSAGLSDSDFDVARDVNGAKRLLRLHTFDLVILDISLPESPDVAPSRDAGVRLLDEIVARDIYFQPREVVGLTGFEDVYAMVGDRFKKDLWTVLHYEAASDGWIEQIQRKVRYILLAERDRARNQDATDYQSHLCIVTALQDPELTAVLSLPWSWVIMERPHDATTYHVGHVVKNGESLKIVAAAAPRMGMPAAAVVSMKLIDAFRPRYLAMTGILAGVRGQSNAGDIVVADPSWDYGNGKRSTRSGAPEFAPAPHQIAMDSFLRAKFVQMAQDKELLDEVRRACPGNGGKTILNIRIGPVASGAAVLADPAVAAEVRSQHRKLVGIEMEAYGVFAAGRECTLPQPKVFSMKSVCDFGDEEKDDCWQGYASHTSAQALRAFVERYL